MIVDQAAGTFNGKGPGFSQESQAETQILQFGFASNNPFQFRRCGIGVFQCGRYEQRVDPIFDFEVFGNKLQRKKDRVHFPLTRLEREFAEHFGGNNASEGGANRAAQVVLVSMEGLQWDLRWPLNADENRGS